MRDLVTSVQIAILMTKQGRAAELYRQLDRVQRETEEVLGIDPAIHEAAGLERYSREAVACDHIATFLESGFSVADLLSLVEVKAVGLEVAS